MVARYRLNALLASFPSNATVAIGHLPYQDAAHLDELRDRLRATHVVKRSWDGIDIIALRPDGEAIGEVSEVRLLSRLDVAQLLLKEWLARSLLARGLRVQNGRVIEYISERPDSNLLAESLPTGVKLPDGVGRRIAADFDVRRLRGKSGQMRLVLCIDVRTRITIDCPLSTLLDVGVDVGGLYVQHEVETPRGVRRRLAGKVRAIQGDVLLLDDHDEGVPKLAIASAFLEPRQENLDLVINAIAGPLAPEIVERLKGRVANRVGGAQRPALVDKWVQMIRNLPAEVAQRIRVEFDREVMNAESGRFPPFEVYEKPQLVFNPGRTKTTTWNQGGLDRFGPYNYERFAPRRLHIAVICQGARQGDVERFVKKLLDGIRGSKWAETGFVKRYHLDDPLIRVFPCRSPAPKHYREAVNAALEDATTRNEKWNLVLVQTDEAMHKLSGDNNPYLVTKVLFLAQQVPTQAFEWESIKPDVPVEATINSIGLACYAKVNGIPWLLPVHQTVAHELVIGLGSYEAAESRFGSREKYIGVTTVFSSVGRYMLESRTPATPVAEYLGALLSALERVVDEVRGQEAWRVDDPVRFVFHCFKDFNQVEVDAVKQLMARLNLPHAEFAFVHVTQDHPYMLFDLEQTGVGKTLKGAAAAPRGLRVTLAREEALLCLKGPNELRQQTDGIPKPILLKLHRDSTFRDLSYLAHQVFDFACLSWRTLLPSPLPISILYSDLVAEKLLQFRDVTGWSDAHILGPIGRSRWFL